VAVGLVALGVLFIKPLLVLAAILIAVVLGVVILGTLAAGTLVLAARFALSGHPPYAEGRRSPRRFILRRGRMDSRWWV
jgi:hypothetical protein